MFTYFFNYVLPVTLGIVIVLFAGLFVFDMGVELYFKSKDDSDYIMMPECVKDDLIRHLVSVKELESTDIRKLIEERNLDPHGTILHVYENVTVAIDGYNDRPDILRDTKRPIL